MQTFSQEDKSQRNERDGLGVTVYTRVYDVPLAVIGQIPGLGRVVTLDGVEGAGVFAPRVFDKPNFKTPIAQGWKVVMQFYRVKSYT